MDQETKKLALDIRIGAKVAKYKNNLHAEDKELCEDIIYWSDNIARA